MVPDQFLQFLPFHGLLPDQRSGEGAEQGLVVGQKLRGRAGGVVY
jgi:hypothetical protein